MRIALNAIMITILLITSSSAVSAPMNSYPKLEIDNRQVYSVNAFPYYDYFVCLRQPDVSQDLIEYLQYDAVFRQSIQKVAGEAAARQYRYLNDLPSKPTFFSNSVETGAFPQKEQVPFGSDDTYRYSYQYLKQPKSSFQYNFTSKGMYQEVFDRGSERHWLLVGLQFLQRESDWKVTEFNDVPELVILVSVDMKQVLMAKNEREAYNFGQRNAELYYFMANAKDC